MRRVVLFLLFGVSVGCGGATTRAVGARVDAAGAASADGARDGSAAETAPELGTSAAAVAAWASVTQTPVGSGSGWGSAAAAASDGAERSGRDGDPRASTLARSCGREDTVLMTVAGDLASARASGLGAPDAEAVVARLRMAGDPGVRPRLFVASGRAPLDAGSVRAQIAGARGRDSAEAGRPGPARCGVAIAATPQGGEVVVALTVEDVADLAPLPTRARTGEWLTLEARLHVPARSAKLVVMGPRGVPRTVPTSLDATTGIARARFALDQPGAFTVQLLADGAEGPRPMLEARVFADIAPTPLGDEPAAPGEEAGGPAQNAAALARMIAALRSEEGLSALRHDVTLDALARAQAERMRDGHTVAHDLGDGDFLARFEADGSLDARAVGENIAHAATVVLAHRALHASPSHRMNLLRADYTHVGTAVAQAADGSVYVCETFLSRAR